MLFVTTIKRVHKTQRMTSQSCGLMIAEYTHTQDEHCDMHLTLGVTNSQPGTTSQQ